MQGFTVRGFSRRLPLRSGSGMFGTVGSEAQRGYSIGLRDFEHPCRLGKLGEKIALGYGASGAQGRKFTLTAR